MTVLPQWRRAMIECIFGWRKQRGKTKHRGGASVAAGFMLNPTASNLTRTPKLLTA